MVKKVVKLLVIILMFVLIINILEMNITSSYVRGMSDVSESLDYWKIYAPETPQSLSEKVDIIVSVVRYVGMIISVITLMVIGIKYMIGSVEERANYKRTIMPWVVGAILVFGITTIPTIIYDASKEMFDDQTNQETPIKPPPNREEEIELW